MKAGAGPPIAARALVAAAALACAATAALWAPPAAPAAVVQFAEQSTAYLPPSYGPGRSVVVGDFNHDGKVDVAFANQDGHGVGNCPDSGGEEGCVGVLLGNGDGTFQTDPLLGAGAEESFLESPVDYRTLGRPFQGPSSLAEGELTADGSLDLVVANEHGSAACGGVGCVSILYGNANGTFQEPVPAVTEGIYGSPEAVAVGDFTGNGRQDIAVAAMSEGAVVYILTNEGETEGRAKFTVTQEIPLVGTVAEVAGMTTANIAGHGKLDLVLSTRSTQADGLSPSAAANQPEEEPCVFSNCVQVITNKGEGSGSFNEAVGYDVAGYGQVAAAELRGSGLDDVLVPGGENGHGFQVLLNGKGTLEAPVSYESTGIEGAHGLAVGAFGPGDGQLDVALAGGHVLAAAQRRTARSGAPALGVVAHGATWLFTGEGTGAFAFDGTVADPGGLQGVGNALATAELNGDCKLDLVLGNDNGLIALLNETGGHESACPKQPVSTTTTTTTTTTTSTPTPTPKLAVKAVQVVARAVAAALHSSGLPRRCARSALHLRFKVALSPRSLASRRRHGHFVVAVHTIVKVDGRRVGASAKRAFSLTVPLADFGVGRNTLALTTTTSGRGVRSSRKRTTVHFSRCLPQPAFTG